MPHFPEPFYWIAASHLQILSAAKLRAYLEKFPDIQILFSMKKEELTQAGLTDTQVDVITKIDWKQIEKDYEWCDKNQCQLITINDSRYPILLKNIHDAPAMLYARGDTQLLSQSQLAMVGSRNPTPHGIEMAKNFARALSQADLVITSGLALGIDAASHRGTLDANGKTIAVAGTGLKNIYPASNRKLAQDIVEKGLLISEFSPTTPPKQWHFPLRNRVISGMSLGVLVIEAALQSGSLITARCAIEQNRDVFAIPGSIHNPLARGCHQLIRQGAKLVEIVEDILEELGMLHAVVKEKSKQLSDLTKENKKFLRLIGYETTSLDSIIVRSGLTASKVSSMLLVLELEGYILSRPGGYTRI
jgi:DNA processing protein